MKLRTFLNHLCVSVFACSVAVQADANSHLGTSTQKGTRGIQRVEAAESLSPGELTLTLAGEFAQVNDLLVDGDQHRRTTQRLYVAWSPWGWVEIRFGQSAVTNNNAAFEPIIPSTLQVLGDPELALKFSAPMGSNLGVGALVSWRVPTSVQGRGLSTSASIIDMLATVSYKPLPWISLSGNTGFILDFSRNLFEGSRSIAFDFAADVSQVHAIRAGLGAEAAFDVASWIKLNPFLEFTGDFGLGAGLGESPLLASTGVKAVTFADQLEVTVGVDVRLNGAPRDNGNMRGLMPWQVVGRLVAHLGVVEPAVAAGGQCIEDVECPGGATCDAGVCIKPVEVEKEVVKEVPQSTFRIAGMVTDSEGKPIHNALVRLSTDPETTLAADFNTGKFVSWPIPVGEGLVKVTVEATGYRNADKTVQKGQKDETVAADFALTATGDATFGKIRGAIKDARNGRPLRGSLFFPALNKRIRTDKEGKFNATLKSGRYQVLISAKRRITQKKEIEIRTGDVVILNVDMSRRRR